MFAFVVAVLALTAPAVAAPKGLDDPGGILLWSVEKGGLTSHLFGTCHLPIPLDEALPVPHNKALEKARVVYTEVDLSGNDPLTAFGSLWNSNGRLSERLGAEDWHNLSVSMRDAMPAPMLEGLPAFAAANLRQIHLDRGQGLEAFLDHQVHARATERKIGVKHVETGAEQFALLKSIDDEFLPALKSGAPVGDEAAVADLCYTGKVGEIEKAVNKGGDALNKLVVQRNSAWAPKLAKEMEKGGVFVAVGAAHLVGKKGLIQLLEGQGYKVTRVPGPLEISGARALREAQPIPVAPAVDATLLEEWKKRLPQPIAEILCADDQLIRQCFIPQKQVCLSRMKQDLGACLDQHADRLPASGGSPDKKLQADLTGCAMTGAIGEGLSKKTLGDGASCKAMMNAVQRAIGQ